MPDSALPLQWILLGAGAILLIAIAGMLLRSRGRSTQEANTTVTVSEDRIQRAAEAILGDASLTDEMDDTPASRLLSWGSTMAKQVANRTAEMDETQAQEFLDVKMQDLRKVIRRINKLVGSLSDASPDEVAETLQKIMDAAAEVPALRVAMPDSVDNTAKRLQALPPEDALNQILSYLNEGDGDGEEKT